nr:hypothetical protein [Desulfobulbaceae bacterium]
MTWAKERYSYIEKTGEKEIWFDWQLTQAQNQIVINSSQEDEIFYTQCTPTGETREWIDKKDNDNSLKVKREGNTLVIESTIDSHTINKREELDDSPWYQALSFSLRPLLTSKNETETFWFVRSDNLDVIKLNATRMESSSPAGCSSSARRIEIRPVGLWANFWHSSYWFQEKNSVLCRYEGRHGLPGTPKTIITLQQ